MDDSFQAQLRAVPTAWISEIVDKNGFMIWSYFVDPFAEKVGIVGANDLTMGRFYLANDDRAGLIESGLVDVKRARFSVNDGELTLKVVDLANGEFQEIVVFDDLDQAGEDGSDRGPLLDAEIVRTLTRWKAWIGSLPPTSAFGRLRRRFG